MGERLSDLSDRLISRQSAPTDKQQIILWDKVRGLGCRITAAGAKSFILDYRTKTGRHRRHTIGKVADGWTVGAARAEAKELRKKIDQGLDPMAEVQAGRDAPTVADLCQRFTEEHLPKLRPLTQRDYKAAIEKLILPKLGAAKVAEITYAEVDALHRKITKGSATKDGAPYRANRAVALLSKMFSLAIKWTWRTDNPCKGIERNQEDKRERYLKDDELDRLGAALEQCQDRQSVMMIQILLLTGCRSGEVKTMRWGDLDLTKGVWVKPASNTKQKKLHRVPLLAPALELLGTIEPEGEYVFPGDQGGHRGDFKKTWAKVCRVAGIEGCRIHDIRHSFASLAVTAGYSLPTIGRLLGHSSPQTTARYAHLQDKALKEATEKIGLLVVNGGRK
jgi:integrase